MLFDAVFENDIFRLKKEIDLVSNIDMLNE